MKVISGMRRTGAYLAVAATLMVGGTAKAGVITEAADWLVDQQFASGGFPWHPGESSAPSNLQGATALGLLGAYRETGNFNYLNAAEANGNLLVNPPNDSYKWEDDSRRFATHDPLFLERLSAVAGDSTYADYTQSNFWDQLSDGTYGPDNLTAGGFGNYVVDGRDGQGIVQVSPWDLSKTAIAASVAGENTAESALMNAIERGLNLTDSDNRVYDVAGLAGAVWASGVTGFNLDPTSGNWEPHDSTFALANELINYIGPNGGFYHSTSGNTEDLQTTAFAVKALASLDNSIFSDEILSGLDYLRNRQLNSGAFEVGTGTGSSNLSVESHSEALYTISTVPSPSSGILMMAAVATLAGVCAHRRRN